MDFSHMDIARVIHRLAFAAAVLHLAACTNLSGLGGGSEFQCKAPEGVPCQSVSGVHHNERAGNLPAQRAALGPPAPKVEPTPDAMQGTGSDAAEGGLHGAAAHPAAPALPPYRKAAAPGADQVSWAGPGAIRSEPTVIRIWVAPWEDADGDLNDQSYVYLQVDSGRWLIEHNRAQIRREFAPQRPLPMPVHVGGPVEAAQPKPPMPAAAPSAAPVSGARTITREEAIALGRAQAQDQTLTPHKPAVMASEARP